MLLSEDLRTQLDLQAKTLADVTAAGPVMRDPRTLVWAGALRCVALAAAVSGGLSLLTILLPPVTLLSMFWAVISPVVVIGLFQARFPLTPMTTGFGARLGFLTGFAIAVTISVLNTIEMLVARFGTHAMATRDNQVAVLLDQFRSQAMAQPGTPLLPVIHALDIPEFRAGFVLLSLAMAMAMLVVVTTAGGTFAGFVRSRARA